MLSSFGLLTVIDGWSNNLLLAGSLEACPFHSWGVIAKVIDSLDIYLVCPTATWPLCQRSNCRNDPNIAPRGVIMGWVWQDTRCTGRSYDARFRQTVTCRIIQELFYIFKGWQHWGKLNWTDVKLSRVEKFNEENRLWDFDCATEDSKRYGIPNLYE